MSGHSKSIPKKVFTFSLIAVASAFLFSAEPAKPPKVVQSTSPELRLKGFAEYQTMVQASTFKDLKWQYLGPTNVSGRVTDVAVVAPKGKNYTIYVASASGGLWKTDNEGTTWTPIFGTGADGGVRRHRPGAVQPPDDLGRNG